MNDYGNFVRNKFISLLTDGYPIKLADKDIDTFFYDFCDFINEADNDYWAVNKHGYTVDLCSGSLSLLEMSYDNFDKKIIFRSQNLSEYTSSCTKAMGDIVIGCLVFLDSYTDASESVLAMNEYGVKKSIYSSNKKYK
jgi:hypothetical protein